MAYYANRLTYDKVGRHVFVHAEGNRWLLVVSDQADSRLVLTHVHIAHHRLHQAFGLLERPHRHAAAVVDQEQ